VVDEVDQVPDKKEYKAGKCITQYKQKRILVEIRLFIFLKPVKFSQQPDIERGNENGKTESDDQELNDLFIECFLQSIQLYDGKPHQVGEKHTQENKDDQPSGKLFGVFGGIQRIEGIREKSIDQHKTAPTSYLEYPIPRDLDTAHINKSKFAKVIG
jgi:hypothetical protein